MIEPYSVFLHLEVTENLRSLPRSERDRILRFAHSLADREVRILEARRMGS